jgi:hypothetical protein
MDSKPLSDLTTGELAAIQAAKPVFLVGSFLSTYAPTNLVGGAAMSRHVFDFVFGARQPGSLEPWPGWFQRDFRTIPFEALMQCYPDRAALPVAIRNLYGIDRPNPLHQALAERLVAGEIAGLITTNYDLGFDACLASGSAISKVVEERDFEVARRKPGTPCYYKIHGSAEDGLEESLVFDLGREGLLEEWKRRLLEMILGGRVLVVLAYSGRDFEICPELRRLDNLERVVWLQPSERDLTPNAKRVLEGKRGLLVTGKLIPFLQLLFGSGVNAAEGNPTVPDLSRHFAMELKAEWRLGILNWMACYSLGVRELERSLGSWTFSSRVSHQSMLGHTGKYLEGARESLRMARMPSITAQERIECLLAASGSYFTHGSHIRSWWCLKRAQREVRGLPATDVARSELTLQVQSVLLTRWMRLAQIARLIRSDRLLGFVQRRAKGVYADLMVDLGSRGAWGGLQAAQHNAERIGIASDGELALPPREGYESLGVVGMVSIRDRDEMRHGPWCLGPRRGPVSVRRAHCAELYGWNHEAWKYYWLLVWRGPYRRRLRFLRKWWKHFWRTQYSIPERLSQIVTSHLPYSAK